MRIAVLGATGKTGRFLVSRLCDDGHDVVAIGRDAGRLAAVDSRAAPAVADLLQADTVAPALAGCERVASLAHARFISALLAVLPEGCDRVVVTGSLRGRTALEDAAADEVRAGEAAFLDFQRTSGRDGVLLHPSMIYGAPEDRSVGRILRLIGRWPGVLPVMLPLPDGGRHTAQPVFVDDVVAAMAAALTRPEAPGPPIYVAGPDPITYADMVRHCAAAIGRRAHIVPIPGALLAGMVRIARMTGISLPVDAAEVRRAAEDKRVNVTDMALRLGVNPMPFEKGLRLKVERGWF